jgi:hypothetical protein
MWLGSGSGTKIRARNRGITPTRGAEEESDMVESVEQAYPHIARWVKTQGWVEIGSDAYRSSFVRALDEGGMVWEGAASYPTLDAALRALDTALHEWLHEQQSDA